MDNPFQHEINALWTSTLTTLQEVALTILGTTTKKNPDWFDESVRIILPLLHEKNRAHDADLANPRSQHLLNKWKNLRAQTQHTL